MSTFTTTSNTASMNAAIGIDPAAAGAVEEHEEKVHVDPYEAAKRLRHLAREGLKIDPSIQGVGYTLSTDQHWGEIRARLGFSVEHDSQVGEFLSRTHQAIHDAQGHRLALEDLISRRLTKPTLKEVHEIFYILARATSNLDRAAERLERSRVQLSESLKNLETIQQKKLVLATDGEHDLTRLHEVLQEIHVLSQSIPTVPNLPLGDRASMALRAIAAMLKANGYLATSITVEDSHAEGNVTQSDETAVPGGE